MRSNTVLGRVLDVQGVPTNVLMMTVAASYGGLIIAAIIGWPLWALVLVAALPWGLVYGLDLNWTYRHFRWLALFYLLVLTQGGHFVEHLAQMVQIHLLDREGEEASGIFSRLDVEWVHFGFNTWIMIAVVALLFRYRDNAWLWITLVVAGYHQIEHSIMIVHYIRTDMAGHPGLLAEGGLINNGLNVTRPDLHFIYNVVETAPLLLAFGWSLRHSYNEWIAKAFPGAPDAVLVDTTPKAEVETYAPGQAIIEQGDPATAFYLITKGEATVEHRPDQDSQPEQLRHLSAGDQFGEVGLLAGVPRTASVIATSDVEVLRLDRETFTQLVEHSSESLEDLSERVAKYLTPDVAASVGS